MAAHAIYRSVTPEAQTISLPVAAALFPGQFVLSDGEEFTLATTGFGRLLLLNNRRFYDQTDVDQYEVDETAVAYRLEVEQEYRARLVIGTYAHGDPLTVGPAGLLAATTGDLIIAYYDGPGETLAAVTLADIVIANAHISA